MSTLRQAATRESIGMHFGRLEAFLSFISARLSDKDATEAESLLHAAIDPHHAARRHRERQTTRQTS
jgi:hypothetical protein